MTVSTLDKRNNKLIFKVHLLEMNQRVLLDFRLSKVGGASQRGVKPATFVSKQNQDSATFKNAKMITCHIFKRVFLFF